MPIQENIHRYNDPNLLNDDGEAFNKLETGRRKAAILLSDAEKFRLFTKMMRIGMMLKNAKKYHLNL